MTTDEAASLLRTAYRSAPYGKKVVTIHLFGIECADALPRLGIPEVVRRSGIGVSYATEVSKGAKLGEYVTLKDRA